MTEKNDVPNFKFALRNGLENSNKFESSYFLPTKGEPFATGYDVRAALYRDSIIIKPGEYFKIPLGFRVIPEEGWSFELHPRSSSFAKKNMHCLIGIIDEHYAEEVMFCGQYIPEFDLSTNVDERDQYSTDCRDYDATTTISREFLEINFGNAIGQIIPVKRISMNVSEITNKEFDRLCKERNAVRNGGFGSTDEKK